MMNKLKVYKNYVASYVAGTKLICEGYNLRKYICEGYNPLKYIYEGYNLRKWVFGSWSGIRSNGSVYIIDLTNVPFTYFLILI